MDGLQVIDFHVHFFPDNIHEKAIASLSKAAGIKPNGNGSLDSLKEYMKKDGINYAINQPVATKAEQVKTINRQMAELNNQGNNVISFGAMHPDFKNFGSVKDEIQYLSENRIKGIKLHPEYQDFYPDDPKMAEIYETCNKMKMIILFHGGRDLAFKEIHGTPRRFAQVAEIFDLKIVCAHMGGYQTWNDVEKYLIGLPSVFFDTAFSEEMNPAQMKEIIIGHGAEKILFGSDFPWQRQINIFEKIKNLHFEKNDEEMIFYKNAYSLTGDLI